MKGEREEGSDEAEKVNAKKEGWEGKGWREWRRGGREGRKKKYCLRQRGMERKTGESGGNRKEETRE